MSRHSQTGPNSLNTSFLSASGNFLTAKVVMLDGAPSHARTHARARSRTRKPPSKRGLPLPSEFSSPLWFVNEHRLLRCACHVSGRGASGGDQRRTSCHPRLSITSRKNPALFRPVHGCTTCDHLPPIEISQGPSIYPVRRSPEGGVKAGAGPNWLSRLGGSRCLLILYSM